MNTPDHPARKMDLELLSVANGWQRRFSCPWCGAVKIGSVGKTLAIRGAWYCNGRSIKNKPQPWEAA